ncbi:ABC transporter substrate-binding protein [Puniceicoccaceae bacterium K14]|nr:ABC transporter substrate-binding protein [Puniceicoccaceae bacterium K14]
MKKSTLSILLICLVSIMLVSCSKKDTTPIRIGINAWPGYEFLYLAEKKGFFEAEGVNVDIVEFNSLADGRRAYERGQLDGLACTIVEHLKIIDSTNRSPKISLVADYSNGADVVMASSKVESIEHLKGLSVGLEIDSLGTFMLARLLDKAGLELEDLDLKPMDQISIQDSICSGEIDLGITYPPFYVKMQEECGAKKIFSSSEIPREIVDIVVLEQSILENRSEDADSIIRAFFNAQEWAYQNPEEAFEIMGKRQGLTAKEFEEALTDGLYIVKRGDHDDFFKENGPLDKALLACSEILIDTKQIGERTEFSDSIRR